MAAEEGVDYVLTWTMDCKDGTDHDVMLDYSFSSYVPVVACCPRCSQYAIVHRVYSSDTSR